MRHYSTLCLLLLVVVAFGCKKNNTSDLLRINSNLRAHFDYKPGTYWIMYDTLNHETDSLYVSLNVYTAPNGAAVPEQVKMTILDSTRHGTYKWLLSNVAPSRLCISMPGDSAYGTTLIRTWPHDPDYATYSDMGTNYTNVYYSYSHVPAMEDLTCYLQPDIGFISIDVRSSAVQQSLHLLRYHIQH